MIDSCTFFIVFPHSFPCGLLIEYLGLYLHKKTSFTHNKAIEINTYPCVSNEKM